MTTITITISITIIVKSSDRQHGLKALPSVSIQVECNMDPAVTRNLRKL
jgi:hypothetical protein